MVSSADLSDAIAVFDIENSQDLAQVFNQLDVAIAEKQLSAYLRQGSNLQAVTWLAKYALSKRLPSDELNESILLALPQLNDWHSQLHILQCFEHLTFIEALDGATHHFIRHCLCSDNKFVRAWAYSAFYYFSLQRQKFRDEVGDFFTLALKDEAPSVKARIRQLQKLALVTKTKMS
ncbi:hypothetical protein [Thalassotalea agarivorans]|uniref:HEAT repeat domain-containing protein n=1 Tax=Thalassotalea agarivorans TaxID=349064 RepID=A0A1I0GUK6_THASX|nr:hypothetical protein [Thalassotalea agarivorans]SET74100.1 hypothetical protein SAMN05660429_02542 [Thalassotalea agarivorans]